MQIDRSYVIDFFRFYMEHILPYEVKYSTLKKRKSYDLHREIMEELLFNFNDDLNDELFIEILGRLEKIALRVQLNYYYILTEYFQEKIDSDILKKSLIYIQEKEQDYVEAIRIIEASLGIEDISANLTTIPSIELHIADSIYDREYRMLNVILKDFRDAFSYLNSDIGAIRAEKTINKDGNNIVTIEDYLQYIVFNEAWNFLSHIAHAVGNFGTPSVYINNIEKGISHLRRAILDIYDGLILETTKIDEEYLQIRAIKLNSLGSSTKIIDLSDVLKKYYLKKKISAKHCK